MENTSIQFSRVLKAGLIAGFFGMGLNNLWTLIAPLFGATVPPGFVVPVTISSLLPVIAGSLLYFILVRFLKKGERYFIILGVAFLLFSFFPIFNTSVLPDGTVVDETFPVLVAPMHIFSGALALYGIPTWSR